MEYKENLLNDVIRHVFISRRHARGLTQSNLSLISNTTRQFISQVESGKRNPSLSSITSFATAVNISLTELFEEVDRLYALWEEKQRP
ncbi:MAG: helix-turn-helix transcriptional regulator [Fibrobacter sp.]|nr:helix-turn-helix transcriptional regulator [Fibrobacter sp.]